MDAQRHDEVITHYTSALLLDPPSSPQGILVKRGEAFVACGSWKQAVDHADHVRQFPLFEVNLVEPSSDDHARSNITMGLQDQAYSFIQGRTV